MAAYIQDEGNLHRYRTEIPNSVVRGSRGRGLSLPARWLYVYLKSVAGDTGSCWQSSTTMSIGAQLSRGVVSQAKKELEQKGLIVTKKGMQARHEPDQIRIKDIWVDNMREFAEFSGSLYEPEEPMITPDDSNDNTDRVHHMNPSGSPHERAGSSHERAGSSHERLLRRSLEEDPKKKKKSTSKSVRRSSDYSRGFLEFWSVYPKKVGKGAAWRAWKRQQCDSRSALMVESVTDHIACDPTWQKGFICNPETFINQQRWLDEFPAAVDDETSWQRIFKEAGYDE